MSWSEASAKIIKQLEEAGIDVDKPVPCNDFYHLISFAPKGVKMLRFRCKSCGNQCLEFQFPENCHPKCPKPDWELMKEQKPYQKGGKTWFHPLGK